MTLASVDRWECSALIPVVSRGRAGPSMDQRFLLSPPKGWEGLRTSRNGCLK